MSSQNRTQLHDVLTETNQSIVPSTTDATKGVALTKNPDTVADKYGIQAISNDGTYKYYFFEDGSANYYVMRKTIASSLFKYTKGTGGYAAVYVDATHGPSGTPTWADYGATF